MTRRRRWRGSAICALLAGSLLLGLLAAGAVPAAAESNDTMATADGPITGSITGAIDTSNDIDWFFFYALGSTQLDIALTGLGPEENCGEWEAWLKDADGGYLEATSTGLNEISHIRYTVASPGTYYLEVSGGCEGVGNYRIDIVASPPLLSAPPAPRALRRVRTLRRKLRGLSRRRVRSRRARRRVRRQRTRLRRTLRRTRVQVRRRC